MAAASSVSNQNEMWKDINLLFIYWQAATHAYFYFSAHVNSLPFVAHVENVNFIQRVCNAFALFLFSATNHNHSQMLLFQPSLYCMVDVLQAWPVSTTTVTHFLRPIQFSYIHCYCSLVKKTEYNHFHSQYKAMC